MTLEAILWDKNNKQLKVLDQLLLPYKSEYIVVNKSLEGWEVINKMQVRGAPAISIVGVLSLASELYHRRKDDSTIVKLNEFVKEKLEFLVTARPTAVNMKKACIDLSAYVDELILHKEISIESFINKVVSWCEKLHSDDLEINKKLSNYGALSVLDKLRILPISSTSKLTILTHCNTGSLATAGYGTALGVIRRLQELGNLDHVYCTETRPYNQGARLTAYELVYEKIPSTLICDDMVGALLKIKGCSAVFVGADRVTRNGDTANKIGTYQIAVIALYHKVPFYVCAPISSIDVSLATGKDIPIEERSHDEMTSIAGTRIAAPGIGCWNPAFDVTPAELITGGIVTEKGVFMPEELLDGIS